MWVAPSECAWASLSADKSMAMIWRAPAAMGADQRRQADAAQADDRHAARPTRTCAVLTTAPTPVSTAQPNSAASSSGTSGSILTTEWRDTVAYSANTEQPRW